MKKVPISQVIMAGSLDTINAVYGKTSSNDIAKINIGAILTANLLPVEPTDWENGYINSDGTLVASHQYLRLKTAQPLNSSFIYVMNDLIKCQITIRYYDKNLNIITATSTTRSAGSSEDFSPLIPSNAAYFKLYISKEGMPGINPQNIHDFGLYMKIK